MQRLSGKGRRIVIRAPAIKNDADRSSCLQPAPTLCAINKRMYLSFFTDETHMESAITTAPLENVWTGDYLYFVISNLRDRGCTRRSVIPNL